MRVAHYLAPLVRTSIPRRHVVFDTESSVVAAAGVEQQRFALGHAELVDLARGLDRPVIVPVDLASPADLWQHVVGFTRKRHRTVCWAHNLAYDLRIAAALIELPRLGFELEAIALGHTAAWARFRGDDRTLLFADLRAWLPAALALIANDLDTQQHRIQHGKATTEQLLDRCRSDVQITRQAVLELLGLVERQNLGPWRPTGAGQSHAAWRRRFLGAPPLVHASEDATAAERRAIWTGRCEVWRWGRSPGRATEYDLQLAYCHVAAERRLPQSLVGASRSLHTQSALDQAIARYAVLAEVDVLTDQPLVPVELAGRIVWPVGAFSTTVWDPELRLLIDAGADVTVRRAWLYQRGTPLRDFARWLLGQLKPGGGDCTPVQQRALKHFSRTVIGRCALRYRSWDQLATLPDFGLSLGLDHDQQTGITTESLQVGHHYFTLSELVEPDDGLPQITGWVSSECRRRLWELMQAAGLDQVLYVDTDSLIVTDQGAAALDRLIDQGAAYSLTPKGTYANVTIDAPHQLRLGRRRRVAGVPARAREIEPGVLAGEVWRGMAESIARREGDLVAVEPRTFTLSGEDHRRAHLPGGLTSALAVG